MSTITITSFLRLRQTRGLLSALVLSALASSEAMADENLFGYVSGAETLPAGHYDLEQFTTLRTGKDGGRYRGWDFESEVEYGVTDQLQLSASLIQHHFDMNGVPGQDNRNDYVFGGVNLGAKYRIKSPYKDGYGLAFSPEIGLRRYDDVGGLIEHSLFIAPTLIYQKNALGDTLVFAANGGFELAWGKKPAEQYDHELALQGGAGISYRFAPGWFAGVETHTRAEYPDFQFPSNFEHWAVFAGPSLHYGAERWWATLTWSYQVYGHGVDEPIPGYTYAEETRSELRLKVGLNF
ncbi:MAG TPA: DUF6662 family protein [Rariglobus sp.]|jgi:hypothetical protein|nr:DUF6662 family protein [Rariglobus sp.]